MKSRDLHIRDFYQIFKNNVYVMFYGETVQTYYKLP